MLWMYAWKELVRRKARTALTVLSIFASTGLLVAVLAILNFFKDAVSLPFKAAGADLVVETYVEPGPWKTVRLARHLGPLPASIVNEIQALPEVESVSGLLMFWAWEGGRMINLAGVEPKDTSSCSPLRQQTLLGRPSAVIEGSFFPESNPKTALVDKRFAEKFQLQVGSPIQIAGEKFTVVGLVDMMGLPRTGQAEVFIPLPEAQRLVRESHDFLKNSENFVNMLLVKLHSSTDPKVAESKIRQLVANATGVDPEKEVRVFTYEGILPDATGVSSIAQQMFKVIALIMLLGTTLLVVKASLIAVNERRNEIGIMKAVGWKDSDIAKLILTETVLQGLVGGVTGCLVGYVIAYLYAATVEFKLPHGILPYSCVPAAAPPQNLTVAMKVSPELVLATLAIAIVMSTLGGYIAAKRAASLNPAEALRRL